MTDSVFDFTIEKLDHSRFQSPMSDIEFVQEEERVLYHTGPRDIKNCLGLGQDPPSSFEMAGARRGILFEPSRFSCGIVT